mgnify:CR=1 FL=1
MEALADDAVWEMQLDFAVAIIGVMVGMLLALAGVYAWCARAPPAAEQPRRGVEPLPGRTDVISHRAKGV